jgi:hypothetical protein
LARRRNPDVLQPAPCMRSLLRWIDPLPWLAAGVAFVVPAFLRAQDAVTQSAGGSGGDSYTVSCGTKAMVGVQGRWSDHALLGSLVEQVQPLCVAVNTGGEWIGSPTSTSAAGKFYTEASSLTVVCPSG